MAAAKRLTFNDFPPDLVTATAIDTLRDAYRVVAVLDRFGFGPSSGSGRHLPAQFVRQLAAALRLVSWEMRGISIHRAAGLPTAADALRQAFRSLAEPEAGSPDLRRAVLRLTVQQFAWNAQLELRSDVVLDDLPGDAALDAVAEYLWATRHTNAASPQP